ncbi:hypothetical protein FRACYDRAFT_269706 [Fragilariopsis cylindrus CCMP1102]|uniref:DUF6824 domain-containing protein n=1 Tax=Fragilariopsis cylindrus CCMP1102 TaxID=635003 RepID=A0A1E7F9T4_9STRA|nr:hypothetical protein FRACYDRAFT_269706 [Fragilariopsis cylindrus CCMP1102]|eukprot:OEU14906.1 hypothetical protein FRACYDRAFT_269706 [Fragilariopsis cylindrus CCMP1102]
MHQLEYEKCSKSEKTELAKRIVTMIKECNGRFLKKDRKLGWQEVTDSQAREKVSHFFRHLRATLGTATAEEPSNKEDSNNNSNEKRSLHAEEDDNDDHSSMNSSIKRRVAI